MLTLKYTYDMRGQPLPEQDFIDPAAATLEEICASINKHAVFGDYTAVPASDNVRSELPFVPGDQSAALR